MEGAGLRSKQSGIESKQGREMPELMEEMTNNVDQVQEKVLADILSVNAHTEYLQRHGLTEKTDRESFKTRLPLVHYGDIRSEIQRIANGDRSPILSALPLSHFICSTGTSGGERKLVPLVEGDHDRVEMVARLIFSIMNRYGDGHDVHRRYRLGRELGRGEFGVTHLCVDAKSNEELACKSISKKKLRTEIDVQDVRREVEIMRSLPECGNIVRLREAYEDREAIHLVMELCEGGELFDRIITRGHYTERAAAAILKTIVEVVMTCHKHGVMHRDLKPENFLFADKSESSPLKAIDFGLSVFFKPGERFSEIVGSPYYMAPEVLKRNYGPEVDIWSAGVILYILLSGVPPFWAETEEGIAQAIVRSVIDFKREPWPRVSENAKDLVRRMLEPDPKLRLTALQVLEHPWVKNTELTPNVPLGETVTARLKQFSAMNKFKKRALRVVAEQLSVEEMAGIKQMFHMMDTRNKGNLSFEELKVGLHNIGETVPDPDVRMLMDVYHDSLGA